MPKWLFHPVTVFLATMLAIWLYLSLLRTEQKMELSSQSVTELDQEVQQIADQVSELNKRLERAQSQQSQEQKIRDELLLKKPGEYVIQLPEKEPLPMRSQTTTPTTPLEEWLFLLK
jgi:cell division protein FtsB